MGALATSLDTADCILENTLSDSHRNLIKKLMGPTHEAVQVERRSVCTKDSRKQLEKSRVPIKFIIM